MSLQLFEPVIWFEQCQEQGAQSIARTNDPGSEPVDAGIEVVQPNVYLLQCIVTDDLTSYDLQIIG